MEKYIMFLDWKNQCSENEYATQSNLQIQHNPYSNYKQYFSQNLEKQFQNLYGNINDPK